MIFEFTLEADPGAADLMTLRDLAEFEVNNRLLAVPEVAAVERLGGILRQFQVQLDPERMSARRISLDEVMHAVEESINASGGIVAQASIEWTVRALGRAHTVDDLRRTVITIRERPRASAPAMSLTSVKPPPRAQVSRIVSRGKVVSARSSSSARIRFRSRWASGRRLRTSDARCRRACSCESVHDQSQLVNSALGGVGRAVKLGGVFVVLVIHPLLGNLRAALLVTFTIPLSIALAGLLLKPLDIGLNTMTLGGLAIAVGLLVDAAIIMVENILHRLSGATTRPERRERALAAAIEVARPIAFATFIVIVVFLPLFGMTGIEGRMYQPLAAAVIAAMAAALVLALTVVPSRRFCCCARRARERTRMRALPRAIKRRNAPALDRCLCHRRAVALAMLLIAAPCIALGFGSAATSCRGSTKARSCCRRCCPPRHRSTKSTGEPSHRGPPSRGPGGRGRRPPYRPRRAHRGSDAAHRLRRARRAEAGADPVLEAVEADDAGRCRGASRHFRPLHDPARHAHRRRARRHAGGHLVLDLRPGSPNCRGSPNKPRASSEASTASPICAPSNSRGSLSFKSRVKSARRPRASGWHRAM